MAYVNADDADKSKQKRGVLSQGLELPALDAHGHSHSGYDYHVPHAHLHGGDALASSGSLLSSSLSGGYLQPSGNAEVHAAQEHLSAAQYSGGLGAGNQLAAAQSHLSNAQLGGDHYGLGNINVVGASGLGDIGSGLGSAIGSGYGNAIGPAQFQLQQQVHEVRVPIPVDRPVQVDRPGNNLSNPLNTLHN